MKDKNSVSLAGQWFGYFSYGPEYGEQLEGERVIFSLLIQEIFNNKFKGKCIELEGRGASTEVSHIEGFIENNFISFRKEYSTYYTLDESGNEGKHLPFLHPRLSYTGSFNQSNETFSGTWEIIANEIPAGEGTFADVFTGHWEISRNHELYGL
jgi:hypothetical protein